MAQPEKFSDQKPLPSEQILAAGGKVVELGAFQPPAPGSPEATAIIQRMREGGSKPGNFRIGKPRNDLAQSPTERYDGISNLPQ